MYNYTNQHCLVHRVNLHFLNYLINLIKLINLGALLTMCCSFVHIFIFRSKIFTCLDTALSKTLIFFLAFSSSLLTLFSFLVCDNLVLSVFSFKSSAWSSITHFFNYIFIFWMSGRQVISIESLINWVINLKYSSQTNILPKY